MSCFACLICLEDYVNSQKHSEGVVWSKDCGHIFHKNCLSNWLTSCRMKNLPTTCPKCCRIILWREHVQELFLGSRLNLKRQLEAEDDIMETSSGRSRDPEMDLSDSEVNPYPRFDKKQKN